MEQRTQFGVYHGLWIESCPQNCREALQKVLEQAGLPDNRSHDLRHSFAVNSQAVGDNIKNVQSNLGHATSAFTMDVYCYVSRAMARESAAKTQKFYESVKPA